MKRTALSLISLLLLLSMLLVGCGPTTPAETTGASTTGTTTEKPTTEAPTTEKPTTETPTTETPTTEPPVVDNTPVTVVESYLPDLAATRSKKYFEVYKEAASAFSTQYAPYAIPDVYNLSNCNVKSITIPVMQTLNPDTEGNFVFTIFVFDNSFAGMKSAAKRSYPIKINAEEYELTANTQSVYRMIKVDLSDYEISLSDTETMAFFAATDTLIPAYTGTSRANQISQLMMQTFEQATGFYRAVGTTSMTINQGFFFFDFELERTYENQAAYDKVLDAELVRSEMILALRERYQGKRLSILGDSISTFYGYTNNTSYNKTIGQNLVYYTETNNTMYDYTDTYWGRLVRDLGMEICVPNAWSGSYAYGRPDSGFDMKDNMPNRATELDNDNGTPDDPTDDLAPDVIIVFIGINDLNHDDRAPFGDLYQLLSRLDEDQHADKVGNWFERIVKPQAEKTDGIIPGTTYTTWEQAYALGLSMMKEAYPDAEIILITLAENNHGSPADKIARYNTCIKAMGAYFGATVIDQSLIVSQETCHAYASDATALHPSSYGHQRMEELILQVLYDKYCITEE